MAINVSKCAVITVGNRRNNSTCYAINNTLLHRVDSITDFGVEVDKSLTFKLHIANIVAKATQRVGILYRGFVTRNFNFMRKAYITYIRPLLEYNSVVWNPHQKDLILRIEKVQRRFTKWIPSLYKLSYSERLAMLNLEPLELRRLRFDLIEYYKILHNVSSINDSSHFKYYQPPASSRTCSPRLIKAYKGGNAVRYSFFNCWNSLPHDIRFCNNLITFKRTLHTMDLSAFITVI